MDSDLSSIQEARDLLARARDAQAKLNHFTQTQIDAICAAMAEAGFAAAEPLAKLAVEETKLGRVDSKTFKNQLCTRTLWAAMKDTPTAGIVKRDDRAMVYEIAEPVGVIAAIIPTTNPTSTALYKALIAVKSRNAIVISPHPRAVRCIAEAARVVRAAGERAGLPEGAIGCMTSVTLEGTNELMRHKHTSLILSTGGEAIVRAAYSSGKPAYGVGPGNAPAYIDASADVAHAVKCIVDSKLFDYGTVCASEQSVVVHRDVADAVRAEFRRLKAHFVTADEKKRMEPVVIRDRLMNPDVVGQPASKIASMCGFSVPEDTSLLVAEMDAVGPAEPLSREKLCPVLGFYVDTDWHTACERCLQILRFGGMGHTLVVHARDSAVIMEYALKKPAYRLLVNTPATHGAVGATTGLFPSMTLGCGTSGGNITADNIGPLNLVNIKRLAFDVANDPFAPSMKVSMNPPPPAAPAPEPPPSILYNGRPRALDGL